MAAVVAGEWNGTGASQLQWSFSDYSTSQLFIINDPKKSLGNCSLGWNSAGLVETDIFINIYEGYSGADYQSAMTHEFGHAAALSGTAADDGGGWCDYQAWWWMTMYTLNDGSPRGRSLAAEDIDGLRAKYPFH